MSDLRQFELIEDLRPFGSAMAVLLRWDGRAYIPTDEQIQLHEFVGIYGNRGDRGYGRYSPESERWEAVSGLYEQADKWLPV